MMKGTPFAVQCEILSEFWHSNKNDPKMTEFVEFNDLGLPLAYAIGNKIVQGSDLATKYVTDTFSQFLELQNLSGQNFDSLSDFREKLKNHDQAQLGLNSVERYQCNDCGREITDLNEATWVSEYDEETGDESEEEVFCKVCMPN